MKESIRTTLRINLTFWRAMVPPGALQEVPVPAGVTHAFPWWGITSRWRWSLEIGS